ncbi:hypothetical protein G7Y79_00004g015570 [Physcia stellaris]|nr:hypothetical protein G7Y79_00004g015570 [Physcia stellaris]
MFVNNLALETALILTADYKSSSLSTDKTVAKHAPFDWDVLERLMKVPGPRVLIPLTAEVEEVSPSTGISVDKCSAIFVAEVLMVLISVFGLIFRRPMGFSELSSRLDLLFLTTKIGEVIINIIRTDFVNKCSVIFVAEKLKTFPHGVTLRRPIGLSGLNSRLGLLFLAAKIGEVIINIIRTDLVDKCSAIFVVEILMVLIFVLDLIFRRSMNFSELDSKFDLLFLATKIDEVIINIIRTDFVNKCSVIFVAEKLEILFHDVISRRSNDFSWLRSDCHDDNSDK